MTSTQSEIRAFLDSRCEAISTGDLDRLMSFYSPDIVYFDIVPPLQYVGSAALRERFSHWFDGFEGSIGQDVHDLTIVTSGDVAVASMLIRASGTRKNGHEVGFWVRATSSFQRSDNGWLITHEHVSLPVDLASGQCGHEPGALDRHRGPFDVRRQYLSVGSGRAGQARCRAGAGAWTAVCGVPRRPSPASRAAHAAPRVRCGSAGLISRGSWRRSR